MRLSPRPRRALASSFLALAFVLAACAKVPPKPEPQAHCPEAMTWVDPSVTGGAAKPFCVDRWEGSLVEIAPDGERPFSPFMPVAGHKVRAVSRPGVVPQAYISRNEADVACRASGKRLCEEDEWVRACEGAAKTTYPYGRTRQAGYCNDHGKPPLAALFANNSHSWQSMNDPRLNQQPETVAKTGTFAHCETESGAYDMVGNVHEWVADPAGTFLGGFYLDTTLNGNGCHYKTVAHDAAYHDYSTGFRCCADAR